MLKKLVRYGNSQALVIDKPILELLNIAENSTLKISTDGKSIILTPQRAIESQRVDEPYNSDQAWQEAAFQELSKRYKISEESKNELMGLYKKFQELNLELSKNAEYLKEVQLLNTQVTDKTSPEFFEAVRKLRVKFSPKLIDVEIKLKSFEKNNKLVVKDGYLPWDETQAQNAQQELVKVFAKYPNVSESYNAFINNPEYLHEIQLIAEKYQRSQDSVEYIKAMEDVQRKFCPDMQPFLDELKAFRKKYSLTSNSN